MPDKINDTSLIKGESFGVGRDSIGTDEDLVLPLETEAVTSSSPTAASSLSASVASPSSPAAAAPANAASGLNPTQQSAEQQADNTVAVALVAAILIALVLFTVAYVVYQKRRQLCGRRAGQADKERNNKPDLSASEALITPVKANGGVESVPDGDGGGTGGGGLVSGPRQSKPRQSIPRKWYDSAAMKYMDQSTDTLDRV